MSRTPPKMLLTREEWAKVPPEARLEVGERRFTYVTRSVPRGIGRMAREERILYEVAIVDEPVPRHGLTGESE